MPKNDEKEVIKQALQEWLDVKFAALGKWTASGLAAAALAGFVYLALIGQGWRK